MPTVNIPRDQFRNEIGRPDMTIEEISALSFEAEKDAKMANKDQADAVEADEVLWEFDVAANRYDLLCHEGLVLNFRVFLEQQSVPDYRLVQPPSGELQQMTVMPETALIRPFVVCAVLRGLKFDEAKYKSFIDLQDKLHMNLCRKRTLVAIGTHDLATLKGPFTYEALPPEEIKFKPLKQTQEFVAKDLMQHYKSDLKLSQFLHIIEDSLVFPVLYDSNRTVLSLPPIINGAHSAISLNTQDVFIECTGTDLNKCQIVLNTMVAMFSVYASEQYAIEPVNVIDSAGKTTLYPKLDRRIVEVDMSYINARIGVTFEAQQAAELLTKMCLTGKALSKERISVEVPPTRSDILHPCDVMEDVAIAYGFNNIPEVVPPTVTVAAPQPINALSDLVRADLAMAGFTEVLTWILGSRKDNFTSIKRPQDEAKAALISNAKTCDFECVRTSLLPGLLKTMGANKEAPIPVKIFEVSDVVELDPTADTGARNIRRVAALFCGATSGFEVIHGLMDRMMEVLGVPMGDQGYTLDGSWNEDGAFFPGRAALISWKGKAVGRLGVVHPEVLQKFGIVNPASVMEFDLDPFMFV
eukprot:gene4144-5122_t